MIWKTGILMAVACAMPVMAVELRPVKVHTGLDGLVSAEIKLTNVASVPLSCTAQLAHWYSSVVATVVPGGEAQIGLWFAPATGAFFLLNDKQDNMPVEALWCGLADHAYETRAAISLVRDSGAASGPRAVTCAVAGERLSCR